MRDSLCLKKDEWFFETSFPGVRRCKTDAFRIDKEVYKGRSKYQDIYIFESAGFGRMLALDGIIQFSESDEFIYHEMIAHAPLLTHAAPENMLLVGGGDGGVLREAAKHPLKELYQVEIDRQVVKVSKKFLPFVSKGAFKDSRLKAYFEDGRPFIRRYKDFFDVVIVDSTDPVGPGKVLFQGDFYRTVYESLSADGVAIFQLGPFLDFSLIIKPTALKLKKFFTYVNPIRLPMPSYSCGSEYCFVMASKKTDSLRLDTPLLAQRLKQRLGEKGRTLKYYTPQMHRASMVMPRLWQLPKEKK